MSQLGIAILGNYYCQGLAQHCHKLPTYQFGRSSVKWRAMDMSHDNACHMFNPLKMFGVEGVEQYMVYFVDWSTVNFTSWVTEFCREFF